MYKKSGSKSIRSNTIPGNCVERRRRSVSETRLSPLHTYRPCSLQRERATQSAAQIEHSDVGTFKFQVKFFL